MPKHRNVVKRDGQSYKHNTPKKFRIGTRKNGVNAHTMSTAALKEVLCNKDKTKFHSNARTVLALRGIAA